MGGEKAVLEASYIIIVLLKEFERVESKDDREYKNLRVGMVMVVR